MNKTSLWVIVIIIVVLVSGFYVWTVHKNTPTEATSTIHPSLVGDLYPLYDKVEWGAPGMETFTISTSTYSGTSISSVSVMGTMDPGSVFTPFERYYDNSLKALGWKIDNYLAAGGHVGGQTGYRKANELILVRFSIFYHTVSNTAPSECPCDVTLSLFSAN